MINKINVSVPKSPSFGKLAPDPNFGDTMKEIIESEKEFTISDAGEIHCPRAWFSMHQSKGRIDREVIATNLSDWFTQVKEL